MPPMPTLELAQTVFLGDDLLPMLTLAFGAALFLGNGFALVRPPEKRRDETDLERAPIVRTLVFMAAGALMTVWALASLLG